MQVATSTTVKVRNQMGQFISHIEAAARETVDDIVTDGAELSRDFAPERTGALKDSITPIVLSRTSGLWQATAPYAMAQETGAVPHKIVGSPDLAFFWEKKGRDFIPASALFPLDPTRVTIINHPGNPATHFLQRGYDAVKQRAAGIMKKNYG